MSEVNRIVLRKTTNGWMADWQGPHSDEVKSLFGTTVLPTCYTARAEPDLVLSAIRKLNPDCAVVLA